MLSTFRLAKMKNSDIRVIEEGHKGGCREAEIKLIVTVLSQGGTVV